MGWYNFSFLFVLVLFGYYIRYSRSTPDGIHDCECDRCNINCPKTIDECTCVYCNYTSTDCDHTVCSLVVNCTSKGLKKMPNLTFNTRHLYLGSNSISTLCANRLSYVSLVSLGLEKNSLTFDSLEKDAFNGLDELEYLSLSNNHLKKLHRRWFTDLKSLTHIILRNCELTVIDKDLFKYSPNLEWINLGDNNIHSLPPGLLLKQTTLKWLEIFNNKIKSIPDGFFEASSASIKVLYLHDNMITNINSSLGLQYLTSLVNLTIYMNPIICNCELVWFIKWTQNNKWRFQELDTRPSEPYCNSPPNLKMSNMFNINLTDLHCNWIWWEVAVGVSVVILLVVLYLKFPYIRWRISRAIRRRQYTELQVQSIAAAEECD